MRTIVIAPHPDDEVLGVGGTLLRRKAEGAAVAWLIVTAISTESGWDREKVAQRADEIKRVKELFGFDAVFSLNFPAAQLDRIPISDLVAGISGVFKSFEPGEVFLPHPSDVHTDHRIVFDAAASCTKWFRYPSVKRVLAYETLSETDFGLGTNQGLRPNVFVDIEPFLSEKLRAMDIYTSELGVFPFPRSHEAIRALAALRGAASGFKAAEAFELLRERS
jgi:LmbE family N-acetylglucosaminyl deacetylase